ncbi:cyanoexosortase B system-associated protein [Argonema antarcticum]|uniref:cyanoexosortase B system-associated protein n=1 Tax=Argonema antarcticum TaxID=2942763 RepID=UPI0020121983|nr:cyanoexosortase B system-associated protein [Argonema antarcticum]MCL1471560.1 cyanoexosortase B system-associated protein [Argonema antarcticum A004/B2]
MNYLNSKLKTDNLKLSQVILLLFLLVLIALGAIPSYLKGHWPWEQPPPIPSLKQIQQLRKTGLTLTGWQTISQEVREVSGHKWSYQNIQRDRKTQAILMLLPQNGPKEQPQVEWVDVKGFWRWKTDKYRPAQFTAVSTNDRSVKVEAQFFQGWNRNQTYAVLQWYALPDGGTPDPGKWFWADQRAQWQGRRVPWVAVNIQIPIEPLGDIEKVRPLAQSLGQSVQSALMAGSLQKK